uniref:Uncharacterized protein n=1 Tax=Arundo donax TaxID=35708 RepID=A0A0A9GSI1_ARUDO
MVKCRSSSQNQQNYMTSSRGITRFSIASGFIASKHLQA